MAKAKTAAEINITQCFLSVFKPLINNCDNNKTMKTTLADIILSAQAAAQKAHAVTSLLEQQTAKLQAFAASGFHVDDEKRAGPANIVCDLCDSVVAD